MRYALSLAVVVSVLCGAGLCANEAGQVLGADEVQQLRAENAALRSTIEFKNKEIAALKAENAELRKGGGKTATVSAMPAVQKLPDQDCGSELTAKSLRIERGENLIIISGVIAQAPKLKDKFVVLSYGHLKMTFYDAAGALVDSKNLTVSDAYYKKPAPFSETVRIDPARVTSCKITTVDTTWGSTMSSRVIAPGAGARY